MDALFVQILILEFAEKHIKLLIGHDRTESACDIIQSGQLCGTDAVSPATTTTTTTAADELIIGPTTLGAERNKRNTVCTQI